MIVAYAVKYSDGSYLEVGCDSITFDRNDMQLFSVEKRAEQTANKRGIKIDNDSSFVVKIDEQELIHSIVSTHGII